MGWKISRVDLDGNERLKSNEERELCIVLTPENRAAIHGTVKYPNGKPVKDALVKLFKVYGNDSCELEPVTFTFTDDCGHFLFGVPSGVDFIIKVFYYKPEKQLHEKNYNQDYD